MYTSQACKFYSLLDQRQKRWSIALISLTVILSLADALGIALFFGLVNIVLGTVNEEWMGEISVYFGTKDYLFLFLIVGIISIYSLKLVGTLVNVYLTENLTWSLYSNLSCKMLQHYLSWPYVRHLSTNSNDLVHNIISVMVNITRTGMNQWLMLIADFIQFATIITMLTIINPLVSVSAFVFLGILAAGMIFSGRHYVGKWGEDIRQANAGTHRAIQESLTVVKEIKLYGREQYFIDNLHACMKQLTSRSIKNSLFMQFPRPVLEAIVIIVMTVSISYFYLMENSAQEIVGLLVLFGAAAQRLMPAATRAISAIHYIRFIEPFLNSIFSDLEVAKRLPPPDFKSVEKLPPFNKVILKNVSLKYQGAQHKALSNINLEIKRGQTIGIVGSSGAGKSSLLDVILGMLTVDEGTVQVEFDGKSMLPEQAKGLFGYVPQMVTLVDNTIRNNIALGLETLDDSHLAHLQEISQMKQFVSNLPENIDTIIGEQGIRLSGGQRQRIAWARALAHDPQILALDEATAALDPITESIITKSIEALRGDKTLIIVAHRLSTVKNCDFLILISDGHIVDSGDFYSLRKSSPLFAEMVNHMAHEEDSEGQLNKNKLEIS